MSFLLITFPFPASVEEELCHFPMFHTYSEEPAQNISADEISWVVTFIFFEELALRNPTWSAVLLPPIMMPSTRRFLCQLLISSISQFLVICVVCKELDAHHILPEHGGPSSLPC